MTTLCAVTGAVVLLALLRLARNIPTADEGPPRRSEPPGRAPELQFEVEWRVAVGCDWSGFFVEGVLGFAPALARRVRLALLVGKCDDDFLDRELMSDEAAVYRDTWTDEQSRRRADSAASVVIEHGDPCDMRAWHRTRPLWIIARAMSEGQLHHDAARCLLNADEVWVPSTWHVRSFVAAGVPAARVHAVPEPINTDFFSPAHTVRASPKNSPKNSPLVFVSVFKWEWRKGWDVLIRAFWEEFTSDVHGERPVTAPPPLAHANHSPISRVSPAKVVLRLRTYKPDWLDGADPDDAIDALRRELGYRADATLPKARPALRRLGRHVAHCRLIRHVAQVELLRDGMTRSELRDLYGNADAFVLATRGEGCAT